MTLLAAVSCRRLRGAVLLLTDAVLPNTSWSPLNLYIRNPLSKPETGQATTGLSLEEKKSLKFRELKPPHGHSLCPACGIGEEGQGTAQGEGLCQLASVSGNTWENARAAAFWSAPDTEQALNAKEQQQPCQSVEAHQHSWQRNIIYGFICVGPRGEVYGMKWLKFY